MAKSNKILVVAIFHSCLFKEFQTKHFFAKEEIDKI